MQPTFGVSFGLPQPSNGGYPINPYSSNPLNNPYGPALNSGGLNLGLVSVNPLVALQVTKNDYGDKVIKPFVNLHVTPNENVVHKIGHLFHDKKQQLLNLHEHYHHYPQNAQYPHYPQNSHYPQNPHYHQNPHYSQRPYGLYHGPHRPQGIQYSPQVYSPHNHQYRPTYHSNLGPPSYKVHEEPSDSDYYDDDNDESDDDLSFNNGLYTPDFGRSANVSNPPNDYATKYPYSRSYNIQPTNNGADRERQTVRFPTSRRRRAVSQNNGSITETIQEVKNLKKFFITFSSLFCSSTTLIFCGFVVKRSAQLITQQTELYFVV